MNEDTKLAKIGLTSGRIENGRASERGNYLFNVDTRCKVDNWFRKIPHCHLAMLHFYFSLSLHFTPKQLKVSIFYLRVSSTFESPIFWAALQQWSSNSFQQRMAPGTRLSLTSSTRTLGIEGGKHRSHALLREVVGRGKGTSSEERREPGIRGGGGGHWS
jgi:hypothetical protein